MNESAAWIWSGDEFVICDSIPLTDRGFRYGMSVFESLPVRGGKPFFLSEHYERIRRACTLAGFAVALPRVEEIDALLRGIAFDAFARIYVTAGDGGPSASAGNGRVVVFAEERRGDDAGTSYRLALSPTPHVALLGGLKTANYWANILALQNARAGGCDEALLFNTDGALVSACMANVFVVQDGKIKTPAAADGARDGVVREWVMGKCTVEESRIGEAELAAAEEIFLTSSWLGIMPVSALEGRGLSSSEVAGRLRAEYAREIGWDW